ncbi:histidine phosphatase family protein [Egicoccus sp. AB-alg2]|uniref:SixA phosphatase family protein n=1 Tax=Egicoccus sp. AB-alg2 TaxID=3242693 RepID=UPI00359E8FFB
MTLLLLRHVHAGERDRWAGDDRLRPVSDRGRLQAKGLIEAYAGHDITRILTSPYARCVQSVEPLAETRGLDVEEEDALAEGTPLDVVHRLLARVADATAVLCSHGDVIGSVVHDLYTRGVDLGRRDQLRWQKGSTWVLDGDPRSPHTARYLPPPA